MIAKLKMVANKQKLSLTSYKIVCGFLQCCFFNRFFMLESGMSTCIDLSFELYTTYIG